MYEQIEDFDPSNEAMLHATNEAELAIIDSYYEGRISEAEMYEKIEALGEADMYDAFMGEF